MTTRRVYLRLFAGSSITGVAGCGTVDGSRFRKLEFVNIASTEADETYQFEIACRVITNIGGEWGTFHDVTLQAIGEGGQRIRAKDIGDMPKGTYPLTLTLERFPPEVRFRLKEDPCDKNTDIQYAYYVTEGAENGEWEVEEESCG